MCCNILSLNNHRISNFLMCNAIHGQLFYIFYLNFIQDMADLATEIEQMQNAFDDEVDALEQ